MRKAAFRFFIPLSFLRFSNQTNKNALNSTFYKLISANAFWKNHTLMFVFNKSLKATFLRTSFPVGAIISGTTMPDMLTSTTISYEAEMWALRLWYLPHRIIVRPFISHYLVIRLQHFIGPRYASKTSKVSDSTCLDFIFVLLDEIL